MKNVLTALMLSLFVTVAFAQKKKNVKIEKTGVEASCGTCNFGMEGKKCALAVKIDGKAYFVEGTDIHKHGDSHAADGFCKTVRKADVKGKIVNGKFRVRKFVLQPVKK
ncbi:hypothetical protein FUAX_47970 (plasmid) [Fulvitalea axinellae]|uniref:Glutaminyl-tRNA synthetase n=1 Tax=Fulvitalea axinellae TaxID=1182444 RepID=A0AAU9CSW1_9BACT|nr:hypothetical protein FUAX_47970 [Fulvitalea axinellae]